MPEEKHENLEGLVMENPADLNSEHSPSIPHGFPKERLPKELCEFTLMAFTK